MSKAMRVSQIVLSAGALSLVACNACNKREEWPGPKEEIARRSGPVVTGTLETKDRTPGSHPRILLTPRRIGVLQGLRDANAPAWRVLAEACDSATKETIDSGYEAWDWGNTTLALAICHKVTGK